jgi:hypothetical protein
MQRLYAFQVSLLPVACCLAIHRAQKPLSVYSGLHLPQFSPEFFYLTAEPEPLHDIKQVARYDTYKKRHNDNSPEGEGLSHLAIIGQRYSLAVVHGKIYKNKKNRNNAAGVKKNLHEASVRRTQAL